ncbi:hypothetical protein PVAP13_5KG442007, partial [Panicum virgatum]
VILPAALRDSEKRADFPLYPLAPSPLPPPPTPIRLLPQDPLLPRYLAAAPLPPVPPLGAPLLALPPLSRRRSASRVGSRATGALHACPCIPRVVLAPLVQLGPCTAPRWPAAARICAAARGITPLMPMSQELPPARFASLPWSSWMCI